MKNKNIMKYPKYKKIYKKKDVIKNIKTYASNFIYVNNEIELVDETLSYYVKLNKYNYTNILDVHYTTDKRIVGSLIHKKNYTLITKNNRNTS